MENNTKKVRLGVVGIGSMGAKYCEDILNGRIEEMELAAVAHVGRSHKDWAKRTLPESVLVYPEGEDLFSSGVCDAVLIASPHDSHPSLTVRALECGLHVLCEKPIAVYTKQVKPMQEAAARTGLIFGLMLNQRTNCLYRKMHEIVHSGQYGALKRVNWIVTDWYRPQAYYASGSWRATWAGEGGGLLINQCYHNLDLLQWICQMPSRIRAFCHPGKWHNIEVEDDVSAYFEFPNGATGVFVSSTGDAPGTNRLEITLDNGKLVCENGQLKAYRLDMDEPEYRLSATNPYAGIPYHEETFDLDGKNEQHVGVLRAFAAAILRGEPLVARGEEGVHALELCNAMYLSSWLQETIELPMDEDLYLEELNRRRNM